MWYKIASFILRYRWLNIGLVALFTLFMGWHASKVEFNHTVKSLVPVNDSDFINYQKYKSLFGEDGNVIVVGVKSDKLFDLQFFNRWYELTDSIDAIPEVEKIVSITRLYNLVRNDEKMKFDVFPLFSHKPSTQAELDSIKHSIEQMPLYQGLVYNPETQATFIAITLNNEGVITKKRIEVIDQFNKLVNNFSQNTGIETYCSGIPYIRTELTNTIQSELKLFTALSIGITMLFLLIFFKSLYAVIFSFMIVIISFICTIGSVHLFGYRIGVLTALIPPLIVVIAIQNCIYLFNFYHQEFKGHGNKTKALIRLTSKIGLASFLTNVTTAIGFGVFSFSGSELLDEFSKISAFNIMVVYIICTILIPIIFAFLPAPTVRQMGHLDRRTLSGVLNFVANTVNHKRKWVYGVTGVLLILSVWGITKVRTIGFMLDDVPKSNSLYTDLKFFESNFNGVMPFEILVDTKRPDGVKDFQTLQKLDRLAHVFERYPEFSKAISLSDMVKLANQAYYYGDVRRFRVPSVLDINNITRYLPKSGAGDNILKSLVDSSFSITRVSVNIADVGSVRTEEIKKQLRIDIDSIFDPNEYHVVMTGTSVLHLKGNDYLIDNLAQSLIYALITISLLMALLFFSYKMVLIALIPNIIPLVMTLAIMGFADLPLKISTILVFGVAYGIVVDLTIHFLAKYRIELKKHNWVIGPSVRITVAESGFSMIYTTVVLFFGFIIFAFSSFGGTVALGVLTSICLFIGLFTNLFLLPSLLLSLEKRLNMKKELGSAIIEIEEEST